MEQCLSQANPLSDSGEYIICFHRKNNPRISVRVCEQNCRFKERCKEYRTFFHLLSRGHITQFRGEAQIA